MSVPLPVPLTIVVPCHDEERRLDGEAFLACLDAEPALTFLFVDDGSGDGTLGMLEGLAARHPRASVLALQPNRGKAEAVRQGILAALSAGSPAFVGYWDADLATPLSDIARFRDLMGAEPDLEIAMGARVRLLGRDIRRRPVRHYLGRVSATLVSRLLDLPVYDTQCGAKLFRVTPTLPLLFAEPFSTRWVFDVELLARWLRVLPGPRADVERHIVEVPLERWVDVDGSKIRPRDLVALPLDLWRIERRYGRGVRSRG